MTDGGDQDRDRNRDSDADADVDADMDGSDPEIPLDIAGHGDRERSEARGASNGERGGTTREPPEATADGGLLAADDGDAGPTDDARPGSGNGGPADGEGAGAADVTGAADDSDTDDGEVEPVEVLVDLARDGEIDPWDIDIVAVTDKFLDRIDGADLRSSGRALFYASVLLRMKGDAMLEADDPDPEPDPETGRWDDPWEAPAGGTDGGVDPFAALDEEIDRRLERKRARGMPRTLDELVRDLREAERDTWRKESREYDTSDSPRGFRRGTQELDYRSDDGVRMDDEPTAAAVTGTTHTENVDELVASVYEALREQYDQGRAEVLYREIQTAAGSRVETFLGLLFLSHRGQVRLVQDELFGDLWIQDPAADVGPSEAVAD